MSVNRQIRLAARPQGFPQDSDFELVAVDCPAPGPHEFLVALEYLSVDPYMRGLMNDVPSYREPIGIGEVMVGEGVGRVLRSNHADFAEGELRVGHVRLAGVCRQRRTRRTPD